MIHNTAIRVFAAAALTVLPATLFAKEANPASKESVALMQDLETTAYAVRLTAASLESFTRNPMQIGRASHAHQLNQLREQFNSVVPSVQRLASLKKELPATDQVAITKTLETTARLSGDINSAILKASNGNALLSVDKEYNELILAILSDSSALAREADAAADFVKARTRAERTGVRAAAGE